MNSMTEYPVYRVKFGLDDEKSGIKLVSIVEEPAIEMNSIMLSEEKEMEFYFSNEDEMRIVGPALIPDKMIFRKANGGYFMYFTKEDIKDLVKKFNKTGDNRRIGLDHNGSISDAFINEQWIVEDSAKDKSSLYGFNLEPGSWMIDVQLTDQSLWNELKVKKNLGFSIEAFLGLKINDVSMNLENNEEIIKDEVITDGIENHTETELTDENETAVEETAVVEETETAEEEVVLEETVESVEGSEVSEPVENKEVELAKMAADPETPSESEVPSATETPTESETPAAMDAAQNIAELNDKVGKLEMLVADMVAKFADMQDKMSATEDMAMKAEAVIELGRQSRTTYDDVLAGKEEFRHLKTEDKSQYMVDRVEQIAKLVNKNK
ncbi:Phage-like element PBSX protein, XkdF [uncultured Caudovirales phage]|uniref:Phage-like element PBSX protein, XkdF n=1 Tax=uncultured Caudovirales phage TaxID=2100421 RepID=A0A6J7WDE3_9CAUD|nr:Phage-like element PBSX protein, XkdF [uncultured Caudovirales phage]